MDNFWNLFCISFSVGLLYSFFRDVGFTRKTDEHDEELGYKIGMESDLELVKEYVERRLEKGGEFIKGMKRAYDERIN